MSSELLRETQCERMSHRKSDRQAEMRNALKLSKQNAFPVVWPDFCPDYWFPKPHEILPATPAPRGSQEPHTGKHNTSSADSRREPWDSEEPWHQLFPWPLQSGRVEAHGQMPIRAITNPPREEIA